MEQKPVKEMSLSEMVAEYNQLTGKNVKRFSARKVGELQLQKARDASKPVQPNSQFIKVGEVLDGSLPPPVRKPKKENEKMETKKIQQTRSIAASNSWNDKEIAEKRAKRNAVKVEGQPEIFYSVKSAFEALGLDLKRHIQFRVTLKGQKRATYKEKVGEEEKEYKFTLVDLAEYQKQETAKKTKESKKKKESAEDKTQPEQVAA